MEEPKPYSTYFQSDSQTKTPIANIAIICLLVSLLIGMFGYYLGSVDAFRPVRSAINQFKNPNALQTYSQAELDSKIDASKYDMNMYSQIIASLKDNYVDPSKVTDEKLFDGSLKGLVSSVGDPNMAYMNAEEYKKYKESAVGTFEGIGVRLEIDKSQIVVASVLADSPAEKAGVKPGYIFKSVDGVSTAKDTLETLTNKVRGNSGSKVTIVFVDPTNSSEITKEITRGAVQIDPIRVIEKNSDTAILEVVRFMDATPAAWKAKWDTAITQIQSKGYKNIILDLRGNGGGFLESGVYAASDFIDEGKTVLTERTRSNGDKPVTALKGMQRLKDKNVVILVNSGTASASEILAGSIKYYKNYKILGTKTYGKGTVQLTYDLDNGGALKVTTEYWLLPSGNKLDNENPIIPDEEVQQDIEKFRQGDDNLIDAAIKKFN